MAGSAPARQNVTAEQLPEGLLWSQTLPLDLQWLDEPGAEQEELAADPRVLPGVQDLLADGLLDLRAVGVGERLDAAATLPDLERADVDLDVHRGPGRIGGVEGDVGLPARDLDGEIVSGLRAQSGTARFDQQLAGLRSQRVYAVGYVHGGRLRPRPRLSPGAQPA